MIHAAQINPSGTVPSRPRSRRLLTASADKEEKMEKENTDGNHFYGGRSQKTPPKHVMLAPKLSPPVGPDRNGSSAFSKISINKTSTTLSKLVKKKISTATHFSIYFVPNPSAAYSYNGIPAE